MSNSNSQVKIKPPLPKNTKQAPFYEKVPPHNVEEVLKMAEEGIANIDRTLPRSISPIMNTSVPVDNKKKGHGNKINSNFNLSFNNSFNTSYTNGKQKPGSSHII